MTTNSTLPRLKMCKSPQGCSNIAVAHDGFCLSHTRANSSLRSYTARPMPTKTVKNPFGVELECLNPSGRNSVNVVSQFSCSDGSLGCDGVEIKLCADANKIGDKAACVAQRARFAGGTVNASCGFHVHMSRPLIYRSVLGLAIYKEIDSNILDNLLPYVTGMEGQFFDMVPRRRRDNQYCRRITSLDGLRSHYSWLSISERVPTIELRIHPGTLNPWKIKAWTELCKTLQNVLHSVIDGDPSESAEKARSGNFVDTLPQGSLAKTYVKSRIMNGGSLSKFGF